MDRVLVVGEREAAPVFPSFVREGRGAAGQHREAHGEQKRSSHGTWRSNGCASCNYLTYTAHRWHHAGRPMTLADSPALRRSLAAADPDWLRLAVNAGAVGFW